MRACNRRSTKVRAAGVVSERTLHERVVDQNGYKYIRLKTGRLVGYFETRASADRARTDLTRAVSRSYKMAVANDDSELRACDLELLEWFVEGVEQWAGSVLKAIADQRGVKTQQDRIALLRNTSGRTPAEAAAFQRKADELEARMTGTEETS